MSLTGLSLSIMALLFSVRAGETPRGKDAMDIPEGSAGLVAYGSLISLHSFESTLGHKYRGPVLRVHLAGYERAWTGLQPFVDPGAAPSVAARVETYFKRGEERVPFVGTVALNIHPRKGARMNAILYLVTEAELARFDKRERGYRRADVTDKIEEYRFRGGKVYAYEGLLRPGAGGPPGQDVYVAFREFMDTVARACDSIGKDFRTEFDATTKLCTYPIVSYGQIVSGKGK